MMKCRFVFVKYIFLNGNNTVKKIERRVLIRCIQSFKNIVRMSWKVEREHLFALYESASDYFKDEKQIAKYVFECV